VECKVCGNKFIPKKENKYVVKDRLLSGGVQGALSGNAEPKQYDAFDCNVCGCQIVAKERLKEVQQMTTGNMDEVIREVIS
ncbi:hypothetical protein C817_02585, partial [Dorea sp. 5-2]